MLPTYSTRYLHYCYEILVVNASQSATKLPTLNLKVKEQIVEINKSRSVGLGRMGCQKIGFPSFMNFSKGFIHLNQGHCLNLRMVCPFRKLASIRWFLIFEMLTSSFFYKRLLLLILQFALKRKNVLPLQKMKKRPLSDTSIHLLYRQTLSTCLKELMHFDLLSSSKITLRSLSFTRCGRYVRALWFINWFFVKSQFHFQKIFVNCA